MNIKRMYRKYREQTGSALIAVLIVFVVFVVLGAAVISLSLASGSQTQAQIYQQQAYFAAKSAVSATMNYIQNNSDLQTSISNTTVNATLGGNVAMTGQNITNPTVTITKKSASSLKVASTATVHGVSATAIAYMKNTGGTGTTVNPFDNIFYSTSTSGLDFLSNTNVYGSIYTAGTFTLDNSTQINGNIYAKGGFTGNNGGGVVNGNVYTEGPAICNQNTSMTNLTASSFSRQRKGTFTVTNSVTLGDNSDTSHISCPNITKNATIPPLNMSVDFTDTVNDISTFFNGYQSAMDSNSFNLTNPQNNTRTPISIGTNGILAGHLTTIGTSGYTVNVNTDNGDVIMNIDSKYFSGSSVNLNNYTIQVTGKYNFYIYLTGNTTLELSGGNPIITMQNYNSANMQNLNTLTPPQIYVIGTGSQTVNLANDSEIDGYVFLPNGTFKSDGNTGPNHYGIFGGVIASSININKGSSGSWQHYSPNLSGTPLSGMASGSGSGGSGTGSWTLDGWADK